MNLLSHMWLYSFSKLRAKFQDENQIWEQHEPILIYLGTEVEGIYEKCMNSLGGALLNS